VWRGNAEAMAERLCRAGLEVVWITLEPEAFAAWCQARGYRNDGEARLRFAAEAVGNMPRPPEAAG
jgi:3-hydroxyisobutyrate dehydrogenase-like beta-hydroxyacid dehydrogenase